MPNQTHSNNPSKPNTYDAGDLNWAHTLAESDMQWMSAAIDHISKQIKELHNSSKSGTPLYHFHLLELITHLDMYAYLADDRRNCHSEEAEKYQKEHEANKKAVAV